MQNTRIELTAPGWKPGILTVVLILQFVGKEGFEPPSLLVRVEKRGLQLIRICLLPPTTRNLGGHRTGSVARRSTFFIFRIPLMVPKAGLEPARLSASDFESDKSTISSLGHMAVFRGSANLNLKRISRACTPSSAASLDNSHFRLGRCHHLTLYFSTPCGPLISPGESLPMCFWLTHNRTVLI